MNITRHNNASLSSPVRIMACLLLAFILAFGAIPFTSNRAYATTSAEKQVEADELMRQLDALQTEINEVQRLLDDAIAAQNNARQQMNDARAREIAATARIAELQQKLNNRAIEAYRNGNTGYLEVLFGSKSFSDLLVSWDMINRLNAYDAQLTNDSRQSQREAEAAHQLYAEQERIAAGKKEEIEELMAQLAEVRAALAAEIANINSEIAELLAEEAAAAAAAAEEARLKALAEEAAKNNGWIDPKIIESMGEFYHPCPGAVISSQFGWRGGEYHKGIDLAAPTGTNIYAAKSGTVAIAGYQGGTGNWIMIIHGNGIVTIYMHASALYVYAGQYVSGGQVIAAVGSTGYSTGPHLHFQIELNGTAVDPYPFIY